MAKILMADDSAFMRKILKGILAKEKQTNIIEASNGQEAVDKFKLEKPDLVLLDIVMEKKDGIEALKEIMGINNSTKVIMVSAVGQEAMVKEAMMLGASGYIVKPFNAKKVSEEVKKLLV